MRIHGNITLQTLEGYGIGDESQIEIMAKEAPELVMEIDKWGANFEKLKMVS